jgi:hypothetical protein
LKVLVACEFSGVVRDTFTEFGHDATSCDLIDSETEGNHYKGDVLDILNNGWDLMIAHPPCTYLCASGLFWNTRSEERALKTEEALIFVRRLLNANIPHIALENPNGIINTRIRPPNQIIQPYEFGEDASKATGLWLKKLPKLIPTSFVQGRLINGKLRWANQTDSGQNALCPSDTRAQDRARTYQGIATAMAKQWGDII